MNQYMMAKKCFQNHFSKPFSKYDTKICFCFTCKTFLFVTCDRSHQSSPLSTIYSMNPENGSINFHMRGNTGMTTRLRPGYNEARVIDLTRLSGEHASQTQPMTHLNCNNWVSKAAFRRPDMQLFRQSEEEYGEQVARNARREITEAHRRYRILSTVETVRTFGRDELEAYWIDAMNQ